MAGPINRQPSFCVGVPNPVHIYPPPPVPAEYIVLSVLQVNDAALVVKLIFIFFLICDLYEIQLPPEAYSVLYIYSRWQYNHRHVSLPCYMEQLSLSLSRLFDVFRTSRMICAGRLLFKYLSNKPTTWDAGLGLKGRPLILLLLLPRRRLALHAIR